MNCMIVKLTADLDYLNGKHLIGYKCWKKFSIQPYL